MVATAETDLLLRAAIQGPTLTVGFEGHIIILQIRLVLLLAARSTLCALPLLLHEGHAHALRALLRISSGELLQLHSRQMLARSIRRKLPSWCSVYPTPQAQKSCYSQGQ